MIRTRFAPSPNGPLHLGHAYAAVIAHDLARGRGGEFLLRIEDIDGDRSRPELADAFKRDLEWLGLAWDGEAAMQSSRLASYGAAAGRLKAMGLLYPLPLHPRRGCRCGEERGPDGPIYAGTCRGRAIDPEGAAWRLDMAGAMALTGALRWTDERAGVRLARPDLFGDVVLVRRDAPASYHLAATLDDAADGVTLVTRGMDLFAASHIHRLLQALLGLPVPAWHHHGLLVEADARGHWRKLAKRRGSRSLADLRRAGGDGHALAESLRAHRFPAGISLSEALSAAP